MSAKRRAFPLLRGCLRKRRRRAICQYSSTARGQFLRRYGKHQGCRLLLLVAEPTIFGAHNLAMAHELAQLFGKRCGAVLNKCTQAENPSEIYCARHRIPVLAKLPFDHALGALNSNAEIAALKNEKYRLLFGDLLENVLKEAAYEATADSER
jgi:hypothetical protein